MSTLLFIVGTLAVLGGLMCFVAGWHDNSETQFGLGIVALIGGFVLLGIGAVLQRMKT